MKGALTGVRVLDLSRFIAGPFCTMLLADMGAEVIKVENVSGEVSRTLGPFYKDVSLYFTSYNRNKKSITLNLKTEKGKEIFRKLVEKSDVVVENFRPGVIAKMGFGYEELKKINNEIILTSISGFGQTGPYRDRAAFDCIGQAMSGLMSLTGGPEHPPLLAGTYISDFVSALYSAFGTVTALYNRSKTGKGQKIDIALLDSLFSILATAMPEYLACGTVQKRSGNQDKVSGPANTFKAKDGFIYIHAGTDPLWARLVKVLGKPELLDDPRFQGVDNRMQNLDVLEKIVEEWTSDKTVQEVEELLVRAGIPVSPVATMPQVVENPQLKHREQIVYIEYPGVGKIPIGGVTVKMSGTPGAIYKRPPLLGEHNEEVYKGLLGMKHEELILLKKEGVI